MIGLRPHATRFLLIFALASCALPAFAAAQISIPPKSKGEPKGNVAPYLVCTVCGQRNYTSTRDGRRDKNGNEIAWCETCKRDTGQRSSQSGDEKKHGKDGGNLRLPTTAVPETPTGTPPVDPNAPAAPNAPGGSNPQSAAGSAAAANSGPAQNGNQNGKSVASNDAAPFVDPIYRTAGAAGFIFTEVRKAPSIDDHLVQKAVESLIALGEPGFVAARASLPDSDPIVLITAARVLLHSGNGDDVELVKNRVRGKLPQVVGVPLVDELVKSDPVRVTPRYLCELLDSPHAGVRLAAERNLRAHVSAELLPLLEPMLASKRAESRLAAIALIAEIDDPSVTDLLLAHVSDPSSKVASTAVSALAGRKDPDLDAKLLAMAFKGRWMLRENCYVLVTIVEREDVDLKPILDETHMEPLLSGLQSNDPFVAGACATALAGIGFRSPHTKATTWLDQSVMDRLIFTVSGKEFHNDFTALATPALRRLRLVSGQEIGKDGPRWVEWWVGAREGFFARRACIEIDPADVGRVSLRYQSRGENPVAFALLGPAQAASADAGRLSGEVLYLTQAEARDLLDVLEREGVFGPDKLPGVRGSRGPGERTLEVAVAGRGKSFTFGANASEPWFERATGVARALRDKNAWQRYPDPRKYPSSLALWQAESEWWSADHTQRERALRMKALLFGVLPGSKPAARDSEIQELGRLYAEEHVADVSDFTPLVALLSDESFYSERTHKLVRLALEAARSVDTGAKARAAKPSAISDGAAADAVGKARSTVDAAANAAGAQPTAADPGARTAETATLAPSTASNAPSTASNAPGTASNAPSTASNEQGTVSNEPNNASGLSSGTVTATSDVLVPSELGRDLVNLLHQKFHGQAAQDLTEIARACGNSFARELARDERPLLRAVAAAALSAQTDAGRTQNPRSDPDLAVLLKLLEDKDHDVEVAAVLALGEHRVEAARTELLVRARLATTPVRVAALQSIGKLGGDLVLDALIVGASDPDLQVRVAAAKGLAELADPASTQLLVSMLAEGRDAAVFDPVRAALMKIGKTAWPELLRAAHSPGNHARREATLLISEQGLPEAASIMMAMLTTNPNDPEMARELSVLTCVDLRSQADTATAYWNWWDSVVHDDSMAWFLGALERAALAPPAREAFEGGGTPQARLFLVGVMARQEAHLVERARRELSRMLGRDVGEIPPRGTQRDAWLLTLRESLQHKREQ